MFFGHLLILKDYKGTVFSQKKDKNFDLENRHYNKEFSFEEIILYFCAK